MVLQHHLLMQRLLPVSGEEAKCSRVLNARPKHKLEGAAGVQVSLVLPGSK